MVQKKFHTKAIWRSDQSYSGNSSSSKTHTTLIKGKLPLVISAAKEFKGDGTKYNPEDLLLTALTSCHMMSYFYVCQQNNIDLISYEDEAEGILSLNKDASGAFSLVTLRPKVQISEGNHLQLAKELHKQAHELCFIANSCNFEIRIVPVLFV
ncbi:MAG: organic hydroperoxide reductase OsmC/OhrA [Saprospiraceae bacterium]|jgi:organic hydroperoxide reductase OsmC/OhrA